MQKPLAALALLLALAAATWAEPLIFAHRGLHAVAPENTMAAFEACVKHGLSIELDVYLSRDGVPVVIHDGTLERTTNGTGRVTQTPFAALRQLDAGSWYDAKFSDQQIPTFEEVLAMISKKDRSKSVHIAINMKEVSPGLEEKVVRLVERFGMLERVFAFGMDEASLARYKAANPKFPVCRRATNKQELLTEAVRPGAEWIWISAGNGYDPNKEEIEAAHKAGKKLIIYLQHSEQQRWRHASDVGVDAICTDYPLEAQSVVGAR